MSHCVGANRSEIHSCEVTVMGRPPKRSPECEENICSKLRSGSSRRAAYLAGGISESTFGRWMKAHSDFAARVRRAEGEHAIRRFAVIDRAARPRTVRRIVMKQTPNGEVQEYRKTIEDDWT